MIVKKTKIVVLSILLILVPILKGIASPTSLEPYEMYLFIIEIGRYWVQNAEKLIGATVGLF